MRLVALALRIPSLKSLMQSSQPSTSSTPLLSRIGPSLKRPHSESATAHALKADNANTFIRPTKLQRTGEAKEELSNHLDVVEDSTSDMPSTSTRGGGGRRPFPAQTRRGRGGRSSRGSPASFAKTDSTSTSRQHDALPGPFLDEKYINEQNADLSTSTGPLSGEWKQNPKSALSNYMMNAVKALPKYAAQEGHLNGKRVFRVKVVVTEDIFGVGDGLNLRDAEKAAALASNYAIIKNNPVLIQLKKQEGPATLSDGSVVTYERARQFMDYYCRQFKFRPPVIVFEPESHRGQTIWRSAMTVGDRTIGIASAKSKKEAQMNCYLDATKHIEKSDERLWAHFLELAKTGKDLGLAPKVYFQISGNLDDDIRDLCYDIERSSLYKSRPSRIGRDSSTLDISKVAAWRPSGTSRTALAEKSKLLLERQMTYLANSGMENMRRSREALPVYNYASDILRQVDENEVTIVMAATGSGKTTQVPQLILDDWIKRERGGCCNIFCTQPRRIAAMSVAVRIASERGEAVGRGSSIGYQVRFEQKLPDENGTVTFCTIGVFLRKMQTALLRGGDRILDKVTHIIVDEVHERDVDTDLLLVVLKRLLADRKAKGNPLKVLLMSATVDPTLFQHYFIDANGQPAKVIEVPGRSYPVQKRFLDDFTHSLAASNEGSWVFAEEKVQKYLDTELGSTNVTSILKTARVGRVVPVSASRLDQQEDLEIPYPLVALTVAHVLRHSDSGHVLVFLPGWEEIQAVYKIMNDRSKPLGVNFNDSSCFSTHILHSTIPLAEQQQIFQSPPPGVRRIILSTNIAETSVTIPDVVYVVDTAKIKENRFEPERHISSLVSAWVGASNLNQRAGRAGRHRPGEYYGILGRGRMERLHSHQTVEMKRVDLSNVVMHVKALNFPGMEAEEVLASCVEPPSLERVTAAIQSLTEAGALDRAKNLTSLGRVLLQIPVEVQVGKLVLLGSLFRCLDQALTLAAILTNRDPFLCPPAVKLEAQATKDKWADEDFRSDALAVLKAYNTWWDFERKGDRSGASRFCNDNFLHKNTLLTMSKIKSHLLQALSDAGVFDVTSSSLGGSRKRGFEIPSHLNENGNSLPLLAALIAVAVQPKFAIRTSAMTYRTGHDKAAVIHPSSVNHRKREKTESDLMFGEKQIFAFSEKRQNQSVPNQPPGQVYLVGCSRLDPMTYMLFGAYNIRAVAEGLECDDWLPVGGNLQALDNIQNLKQLMDECLLRVFEGIHHARSAPSNGYPGQLREIPEDEDEGDDLAHRALSLTQVRELDNITRHLVRILDKYANERRDTMSRRNSRPVTPIAGSPALGSLRLPGLSSGGGRRSGTSTPYHQFYDSRPATPSRLR